MQGASNDIKDAEAQRKALQKQAASISKGDPVNNAATMLSSVASLHWGQKKPKPAANVAPAFPCASPAGPSASNPGSGRIFSDARTSQVVVGYRRGDAMWGFSPSVPLHSEPSAKSPLVVQVSIQNSHADANAKDKHIVVAGLLSGYDSSGNAYVSVTFPERAVYRVDNSGTVTPFPALPAGLSFPEPPGIAISADSAAHPGSSLDHAATGHCDADGRRQVPRHRCSSRANSDIDYVNGLGKCEGSGRVGPDPSRWEVHRHLQRQFGHRKGIVAISRNPGAASILPDGRTQVMIFTTMRAASCQFNAGSSVVSRACLADGGFLPANRTKGRVVRARIVFVLTALHLLSIACRAQHYPILRQPDSPHNIFALLQDSKSRIWIGTRDDLFCFDGARFYSVRKAGLPEGDVRSLAEDSEGAIWIGTVRRADAVGKTSEGVYRYSSGKLE